jgi:methylamine dehydrogenase accessory protein MauD
MQAALPYIVIIQLVVSLTLAVLVFGLARQVGILHERVAPMGAMTSDHGPAVGDIAPTLTVSTLAGTSLDIGGASPTGLARLLLFVSPDCPVCKKLLPIAGSFSKSERLEIVLVGDGDAEAQRAMLQRLGLEHLAFVNSSQVGMVFQVGKLPYAILIDGEGVIRAKGLVNNREHLESLIVAEEMGFGSIQAYLAAKARATAPSGSAPSASRSEEVSEA